MFLGLLVVTIMVYLALMVVKAFSVNLVRFKEKSGSTLANRVRKRL